MNTTETAQRLTSCKGKVVVTVASTGTIYFKAERYRDFRSLKIRVSDHTGNPLRPMETNFFVESPSVKDAKQQIYEFLNQL